MFTAAQKKLLADKELKNPSYREEEFIAKFVLRKFGFSGAAARRFLYIRLTGENGKKPNNWKLADAILCRLFQARFNIKPTLMPVYVTSLDNIEDFVKTNPYILNSAGLYNIFILLIRIRGGNPYIGAVIPPEKVFDVMKPFLSVLPIKESSLVIAVQPLDAFIDNFGPITDVLEI